MSSPYRIGIVGTGGIAHAHVNACKSLDEADIAAVCDINQESAIHFGDLFDVPSRYSSLEAMLSEESLDVAIICTWGHTHAEIANTLSRSGQVKAILCEKPLCKDTTEARDMVAVAETNGVILAEAFKFRHHPQHLKMKEVIDSGRLGNLHTIRSTFLAGPVPKENLHPDVNWRFNKIKGGGSFYDLGCYCIHHARFIADAEPVKVFAFGYIGPVSEIDEMASAVLEFPGEVTASINIGFRSYGSQTVEIYGENGVLTCDKAWNNENQPVSIEAVFKSGGRETYNFPPADQFALQLRHLFNCLEDGIPHRISPQDSIDQMRVIDAMFESIATGEAVSP